MMNKTRFSAILMSVVMLVSMLSCMVLPAAAANGVVFGGPLAIEEANGAIGRAESLPTNVKIVNDDWTDKTGFVSLRLGGKLFSANMGSQAFAEVADAVSAAQAGDVLYVAPGTYDIAITFMTGNIKLFGPNAGVNPNAANVKDPNPNRVGASLTDLTNEAILTKALNVAYSMYDITIDGFMMAEAWTFANTGNQQYRNGLYFRNNIYNSPVANIFQVTTNGRAWSGTVVIENSRFFSGTNMVQNGAAVNLYVRNNYIAIDSNVVQLNSVSNGSIGDSVVIEGNYVERAGSLLQFTHDQSAAYNDQAVLFGVTVKNNTVADADAVKPVVNFKFDGRWTLPGTNVNITGNKIYGIDSGITPFVFYYKTFFGNNVTFRHFINLNENYVDLPTDTAFVSCDVNGVLNLSKNYYTNGITAAQILVDKQVSDTEVVLYPYYKDAAMTQLQGSNTVNSVVGGTVDQEKNLITIDLRGKNPAPDYVDLSAAFTLENGCVWSLYEEETLATAVDKTMVYLDGESTNRYALVENTNHDGVGDIYRVLILRDACTKAELLDLQFDADVAAPSKSGKVWTYNLASEQLFLNYRVKVSAGATYELFADSGCKNPAEDLSGYIPYGGYTVYVKVTGATGTSAVYTVKFNRSASTLDPTIVSAEASVGDIIVRNDADKIFSYLGGYYSEVTYTLTPTAGSTYRILKGTTEVSSSAEVRAIKLESNTNNFTVEVKDAKGRVNTLTLSVENGVPSSDATILNIPEYSVGIADGVITFIGGGSTAGFTFETRDPNATCRVFADPGKKVEIVGNLAGFTVPIELQTNVYYVVCTAQDGVTTKDYKMVITKNAAAVTFADLTDLNAWYADYVREAAALGLMQGSTNAKGETVFRANDSITRQEMASVVCHLMGLNSSCFSEVALPFKDASSIPAWAKGYAQACYLTGYIKGAQVVNDLYFQPKKIITREEVMTIFARILNLKGSADLSCFTDASSLEKWAVEGAEAMVAAGLIEGCGNGELNPKDPITRAEMAALVVRAYNL